MDSLPKTPDSEQPCEAVPCSALVLLLTLWLERVSTLNEDKLYWFNRDDNAYSQRLGAENELWDCICDIERMIGEGKKENDQDHAQNPAQPRDPNYETLNSLDDPRFKGGPKNRTDSNHPKQNGGAGSRV